eukprot:scaffold113990_cov63-Phaeocystis_antarctica.AAC.1
MRRLAAAEGRPRAWVVLRGELKDETASPFRPPGARCTAGHFRGADGLCTPFSGGGPNDGAIVGLWLVTIAIGAAIGVLLVCCCWVAARRAVPPPTPPWKQTQGA